MTNGSFESYNPPQNWNNWPGGFYDVSTVPSPPVLLNWNELRSPDYFNSASQNLNGYGVPTNLFGYSSAQDGNAYIGIGVYPSTGSSSEYAYQNLISPLISGHTYCLSFFVSRADRKEYALKDIGAYFSPSIPTMVSNNYISSIPQVLNQNGFLVDTTQWIEITGCFIANGGEQYITIGNFDSNANRDTLYVGSNNPFPFDPLYAYYFVDNITLVDQASVGVQELFENDTFEIYPNPTSSILNISDKKSQFNNATVLITDYLGQSLFSEPFSNQIDLSTFSSGIYFLIIEDKFLKKTFKVIKQ